MKITIVGGGTAGWIAAYYISKAQPKMHEIAVIESSKIGIIGAGEGSTGSMVSLLDGSFFNYKANIEEFVSKTDATPKMGIRHKNWGIKKESYYAPLDVSPTGLTNNDYIFKHVLSTYGKEKMHLASKIGQNYENNKYYNYSAFHFDGHKVGKFFKEECLKDGVKVYDSVVQKTNITEQENIKSIVLDDGYILESDLFIDCTGFSRLLMKSIGTEWVSKKDVLPMDTAMPFLLNYSEEEVVMPETTATALSSGWMWDIPLYTRRGCGYVFDSSFISKEDAQKEIETYLGKEISPIKFIDFDSGYSSYFWKNNVLCLGLSSSFVEPLEATSIHNTIVQISIFVDQFLDVDSNTTFVKTKQNLYNKRIKFLMDLTVDFISLHYQGGRKDTEFWKHIVDKKVVTENANTILEQAKYKIPGYTIMEGMYGSFSVPLANWNLAGMGIITKEQAKYELEKESKTLYSKKIYEDWVLNLYS
jgi:tryptophan halogenase